MNTTPSTAALALAGRLVEVLGEIAHLHDPSTAEVLARAGNVGPARQLEADASFIGNAVIEYAEHQGVDPDSGYNLVQHLMGAFDADIVLEECDPERVRQEIERAEESLARFDEIAERCGLSVEDAERMRADEIAELAELHRRFAALIGAS